MILIFFCPIFASVVYNYLSKCDWSWELALVSSLIISYIPTYAETLLMVKQDGYPWPSFQKMKFWNILSSYFDGQLILEEDLNNEQLYIFCCFPHGPCSINHLLTMSDCCGMLTKTYKGQLRKLAASILHIIPIIKELVLFLGCVDAGAETANYNLSRGRSLLIYVGGEKEQLMSESGKHTIYLKQRKGFVRLALQHGAHLIPMYAFGENECYTHSKLLIGPRMWLQSRFKIALPIVYGRWGTPIPHKVSLHMEVGKPLPVTKIPKEDITQELVDEVHGQFMKEMTRLFDRTKGKHPEHANATLEIV